ncbi:protein ECT2-like [Montipora capricornis]|uniref:protein ECT2-like n=1 Tax=Montipora capricornis TaxID=246305 RepID=UPI0035F1AC39
MDADNSGTLDASDHQNTSREGSNSSAMETRLCVVGKENGENKNLMEAIQTLDITVTVTDNVKETLQTATDDVEVAFICDPFEGDDFELLRKEEQRIIGPPIVYACAQQKQPVPCNSRPLYCSVMSNHIICFTGFRKKEDLGRLCNLVHHMGGSIRREFSGRVTQLVANSIHGHKYRAAVSLGIMIMTEEWVTRCWERRHELGASAMDAGMEKYKMMPFHGCFLSFHGFSDEEKKHMEESTEQQGGVPVEASDTRCTHLVVEDSVTELPSSLLDKAVFQAVRQEWFWASIHMDACADESLYHFTAAEPSETGGQQLTPGSRKRKRRKLKDSDLSDLLSPDSPLFRSKRKSGDLLSSSGSLLENSLASPATPNEGQSGPATTPVTVPPKPLSSRQQVALELLQTERNYVEILSNIFKVFKEPLEKDPRGGSIISAEDIKTIFGRLPGILEVHNKIMHELELSLNDWKEENCIGNIISSHAEELVKVYPPFVNYFEMTKETVARCDRELPRFHAFLKACLSRPECGRQSLAELLIRPVQRLPSMNLLLTDLLKHTDKKNPDNTALGQAVDSLKNVMTHINEDKRKTEGQVQMFEILRDVDNCPAYVLSSHRVYVSKADTFELSDTICGKGQAVTIFLFNDSLEVTKRRGLKMMNNVPLPMKSPATGTPKKAYKHIKFMPLSHVRRVVDIRDNGECQNLFGIIYRCSQELKEKLLMFRLVGEDIKKQEWLQKLTTGLANAACTADSENFLTSVDAEELMLTKSDMSNGTLFRAIRVAKRTKRKVSRALSMNKTPKKAPSLRRATSSISPSTHRDRMPKASPLLPSALLNQVSRPRATSVPAADLMSP